MDYIDKYDLFKMSKNLVLSAAIGYKFSQIEFFIKSLRKFYKDKVVLLMSGGDIKLDEELKKFNCEISSKFNLAKFRLYLSG